MFNLPHNFGDYTLIARVDSTRGGILYQAIQQGMARSVFLELLAPDNEDGVTVEEFIMNARTRAGINVPLLGTVYEAAQVQGYWFVTSEQLGVASLQALIERGEKLSVKDLLTVIETVGKACAKYEALGMAFMPVKARDVFPNDKSGVRLMNTAVPGVFRDELSQEQMRLIGQELAALAPRGVPGATRIATLLDWMSNGQNGRLMDWEQVMELIKTVREQLGFTMPATSHRYSVPTELNTAKSHKWEILGVLGTLGVAAVAFCVYWFGFHSQGSTDDAASAPPPKAKNYPDFRASVQTELKIKLPGGRVLSVGAHEVTIEAYNAFLNNWKELNPELKERYSHPDQPDKLTATHKPADWDAMWKAACSRNGKWQGKRITRRSPVTNLTFWDAYAFAACKHVPEGAAPYRLPTREEWMAIASMVEGKVSADKTLIIDKYSNDHEPKSGLCGICSGVREWTASMEKDPSRIKEPACPVICGGDHKKPGIAESLEYLPSRGDCRPNLGFRIVRDIP